MKKTILLSFMVLLLWCFLIAEDTVTGKNLVSNFDLQKEASQKQRKNPLENKTLGIDVNPLRILISNELETFSGTISFFSKNGKTEIAFPFYYHDYICCVLNYQAIVIDWQYRYFLNGFQNGLYYSGFIRYAKIDGFTNTYYGLKDKTNKLGLGVGMGYKVFTRSGFYWGVSINYGFYPVGKNKITGGLNHFLILFLPDNDSSMIFNVEFLKFGWAF